MRTLLVLGTLLGVGGLTPAGPDGHRKGGVTVKTLSAQDVAEAVDGKEARATTVEVTMGPGQGSPPHRHAGPVFGYVLEGEYEWALDDRPAQRLRAGDTFYEPAGSLHRVSRNPGTKGQTRVLAVVLHPRDARQITTPEPPKK